MPPLRKIQKKDVIDATLSILKEESLDALNARRIATELNCSVQPIFYNFSNMEEVKEETIKEIYKIYENYMIEGSKKEKAYKEMGLAYIKFAKDYPNYFKILFMNKTEMTPERFILNDSAGNQVIKKGMVYTGFTYEAQKEFHLKVWIFTHGLASLIATKTVQISEEKIDELLQSAVREMLIGRKKEQE